MNDRARLAMELEMATEAEQYAEWKLAQEDHWGLETAYWRAALIAARSDRVAKLEALYRLDNPGFSR
jgi:hypothetical protein